MILLMVYRAVLYVYGISLTVLLMTATSRFIFGHKNLKVFFGDIVFAFVFPLMLFSREGRQKVDIKIKEIR